jgi:phosphate transport system protein
MDRDWSVFVRRVNPRQQYNELENLLQAMCDRVFTALHLVRRHMEAPESTDLLRVVLLDSEVDGMERAIDEKILQILATQQPLGFELRQAYAIAKIAHQIERIGDATVSLARQTADGKLLLLDKDRLVMRMLDSAMRLFQLSYKAMFEGEFDPVIDIYQFDDSVDALHRELFKQAKGLLSLELEPFDVDGILQLMSVGNRLEKIADICCTWAEQIDFMRHGMHRRRMQKPLKKIVIADTHRGLLAGIVASYISASLNFGARLSVVKLSDESPVTMLGPLGQKVVGEAGLSHDVFPVTLFDQFAWERVLVALFIGPAFADDQGYFKASQHPKVVRIDWSDLDCSPEQIQLLAEADLEAVPLEQWDCLLGILKDLRRRAQSIRSLLGRM